jgi:hypothetical protein
MLETSTIAPRVPWRAIRSTAARASRTGASSFAASEARSASASSASGFLPGSLRLRPAEWLFLLRAAPSYPRQSPSVNGNRNQADPALW